MPRTNARLRPNRSPTLLLMRMNAADTSASIATADWTPLTVVSRSWTTAEIDTFMNEVSITNTNIAAASRMPCRGIPLETSAGSTLSTTANVPLPAASRCGPRANARRHWNVPSRWKFAVRQRQARGDHHYARRMAWEEELFAVLDDLEQQAEA